MTHITVAAGNIHYADLDGVLFDVALETLIQYPAGRLGAYVVQTT